MPPAALSASLPKPAFWPKIGNCRWPMPPPMEIPSTSPASWSALTPVRHSRMRSEAGCGWFRMALPSDDRRGLAGPDMSSIHCQA